MMEVLQFILLLLYIFVSLYVYFFMSWSFKIGFAVILFIHRYRSLYSNLLAMYQNDQDTTDFVRVLIPPLYLPLVCFKVFDIMTEVLSVTLCQLYIQMKNFECLQSGLAYCELCVESLEKMYVYQKQKAFNIILLHVKKIIMQNIVKIDCREGKKKTHPNSYANKEKEKHNNMTISRTKNRKFSINESLKKLQTKNKGN